jgi:hypothetical protein
MNCDKFHELVTELLAGRLDPATRERAIAHVDSCSACRIELGDLGAVWRGLESMQLPEPDPAMKARFMDVLEAYKLGMFNATPPKSRWAWWPAHPVWQTVLAASLLVGGILGGRFLLQPRGGGNPQIAQLEGQVENLRQLVTLSMLQQQSPSARMRGVNYSYQISQPDAEVEQALLHTVNHDANVNVRLAAVDALTKFASNPQVSRALADSVPIQDSPLVQAALIDLLTQVKDADAAPMLLKLAGDQQTNELVRAKAAEAVKKLEVTR